MRKLPDGYIHRLSGAAQASREGKLVFTCDGCRRKVSFVIGWEKEGDFDKWLCVDCNLSETMLAYPEFKGIT